MVDIKIKPIIEVISYITVTVIMDDCERLDPPKRVSINNDMIYCVQKMENHCLIDYIEKTEFENDIIKKIIVEESYEEVKEARLNIYNRIKELKNETE